MRVAVKNLRPGMAVNQGSQIHRLTTRPRKKDGYYTATAVDDTGTSRLIALETQMTWDGLKKILTTSVYPDYTPGTSR